MAQYFFDTSAFAKYYHTELGSQKVAAIFAEPSRLIRVSSLGVLETQSVFAMKVRVGEVDRKAASTQRAMMMLDIASGTIVVHGLRPDHLTAAERLIGRHGFPEPMLNRILRMAAFQNPEFYKTQAMRLSTWDKPRVILCAEEFPQLLALPRGCFHEVRQLLKDHGIRLSVRDERFPGRSIDVTFRGTLRDEQIQAVRQALHHDEGVLCAPTAFGKTVAAAKLIAERRVSTLILVHRRQLLDQWRARLAVFLDVPMKSIGQIAGGKVIRTGVIDVALIQSLQRKGEVRDFVADYGHVIVDECHHLAAFSFEQIMKQVKAKYVVGLTATPTRKDGHHPIIFMQCGPVRFSVSARDAAARSPLQHYLMPRPTNFRMPMETPDVTIQDIYRALVLIPIGTSRSSPILWQWSTRVVHRSCSPIGTDHLHVWRRTYGLSTTCSF